MSPTYMIPVCILKYVLLKLERYHFSPFLPPSPPKNSPLSLSHSPPTLKLSYYCYINIYVCKCMHVYAQIY